MAKFNRNMIKGVQEESRGTGPMRVGAGLLNELSSKIVKLRVEHIERNLLDKNPENEYSIDNIESLAWSIKEVGLLQPLHVRRTEDGRFRILGGERRLTAIDKLIADPEEPDWTEDTLIPVVVKEPGEIALPLTMDLKEKLSIITTNKETRKYTDGDKLLEIRAWKQIIEALRDAGVESIPGHDPDGNEMEITIRGQKTRDILTQTTGLSRGQINAYEKVENQGSEEIKEALLNNNVTITAAKHLVDNAADADEQDTIIDNLKKKGDPITGETINKELKKRKRERLKRNRTNSYLIRQSSKKTSSRFWTN